MLAPCAIEFHEPPCSTRWGRAQQPLSTLGRGQREILVGAGDNCDPCKELAGLWVKRWRNFLCVSSISNTQKPLPLRLLPRRQPTIFPPMSNTSSCAMFANRAMKSACLFPCWTLSFILSRMSGTHFQGKQENETARDRLQAGPPTRKT